MLFLVKTKLKIDISFDSKNAEPHNIPAHVTYHRDSDIGSNLIYWHTLPSSLTSDPSGQPSDPCRWTEGWNFSPFYRTLTPFETAALVPPETSKHQRSRARELLTL